MRGGDGLIYLLRAFLDGSLVVGMDELVRTAAEKDREALRTKFNEKFKQARGMLPQIARQSRRIL